MLFYSEWSFLKCIFCLYSQIFACFYIYVIGLRKKRFFFWFCFYINTLLFEGYKKPQIKNQKKKKYKKNKIKNKQTWITNHEMLVHLHGNINRCIVTLNLIQILRIVFYWFAIAKITYIWNWFYITLIIDIIIHKCHVFIRFDAYQPFCIYFALVLSYITPTETLFSKNNISVLTWVN